MVTIDLNSSSFHEKVYGCWLGKNCGGTLGAPLEEGWGKPEPFDVWWYPRLQEGGIPNDDLEMQLIWLKALEEVGPHLKAADLASYWLTHIGYNWDEYGLTKTNLRLGLLPPVSGAYNNWFKDCMGSPIRSEIWACVAPGHPSIAAHLAYEDAICDHAGGEGVFGSLFNAAVESAAFVIEDRAQLIEIGLSYIPAWSETAKAIQAARAASIAGEDWRAARQRVLRATPSPVAQYAPINLGFQVIGWLYGNDFGDALCKAVNCGYDTDCTGATLGSILGILAGQHGLPDKWIAPLGETIATNESWGGLRHASDGSNPIPTNLTALTDRVCALAKRVLTAHGKLNGDGLIQVDPQDLLAGPEIHALWETSPFRLTYQGHAIEIGIDYEDGPACVPDTTRTILTTLTNRFPDPLRVHGSLVLPDGWQVEPSFREPVLAPQGTQALTWTVTPPSAAQVENSNRLLFSARVRDYPAESAVPIVLIGARKYRYSGPYPTADLSDEELLARTFEPEMLNGSLLLPDSRPGDWQVGYTRENALLLGDVLARGGVLYVQTYLWSPTARQAWMGAATTCPVKYWLNGELLATASGYRPLRPNYGSETATSFATGSLREGWNEVLIKFVRTDGTPAFEGHLLLSSADQLHNGFSDIRWTRLPWESV